MMYRTKKIEIKAMLFGIGKIVINGALHTVFNDTADPNIIFMQL